LPITSPNAPQVALPAPPRVRGWSWFPPYHDPEKIIMATDAGVVGLFGVRQRQTEDPPLFPLMRDELKPKFTVAGDGSRSGRAQVVYSQGDDLWVLAQGGLQKFCFTLDPKSGPRVVEDRQWKQPLPLGSPLHRSQVDATGATLFLVTQSLTRNACLATAVEA